MTFEDAIGYLEGTLRFGSKPGLERVRRLLELLGNPQDGLRFIHVAGTNGKGSTATAIADVLACSGVKTGLYLSPHVCDFCERIQINGSMIPREALAEGMEAVKPVVEAAAREGLQATEFEIVTALALRWFRRQNCGAVVLEVGLGGRFDATNVISRPLVSVITSISYDHTAILGNTLSQIAFEKCGIIKAGGVTVSSPQNEEAMRVIRRICAERSNTLAVPDIAGAHVLNESLDGTKIIYEGEEFFIPLAGRHQIGNFLTAYEALKALRGQGFAFDGGAVRRGMAAVRIPARLEVLHREPLVLLDGAHNPAGASALAGAVRRYLHEPPVLVLGILADKDYETVIGTLAPLAKAVVAVRPDSPRALDPQKTAETASRYCPRVFPCEDHAQALEKALETGAPVLICGSLYLAGSMRRAALRRFGD